MVWPFSSSYPTRSPSDIQDEYDYIVVGGGTAGAVLARRLSDIPNTTVLLVERGNSCDFRLHRIPLLSSHHFSNRKHSITVASEPVTELNGRKMEIISGKGLGGSSRINSMYYTRGTPAEYNKWSSDGRVGWSYNEVKEYFVKSEKWTGSSTSAHHGYEGEWQVRTLPEMYFKYADIAAHAADRLGVKLVEDANSPLEPVVGCHSHTQYTMEQNGWRHSTNRAFLPERIALERAQNLHICTNSIASKIMIEKGSNGALRAEGVIIQSSSSSERAFKAKARKEIVLACGALRSPQVLMLSGIGPAEHLASLGIPVIKDLPGVGSHLQDHIGVHLNFSCPGNDSLISLIRNPLTLLFHIYQYAVNGTGYFLAPIVETSIFTRPSALDSDGRPIKLSHDEIDSTDPLNIPSIEVMIEPIADPRPPEFKGRQGVCAMIVALLKPQSNGTVRLISSNPRVEPRFDLASLAHDDDLKVLREGIRFCLHLKEEIKTLQYPLVDVFVPTSNDDHTIDDFVRKYTTSLIHYSSTCRMAPEQDKFPGVVDDELRVHGVPNLRIADASIFPDVPATHLQAPVVMVAEKCADMIKRAHHVKL